MNLRTLFLYFFLLCLSISEPCSAFLEKDVHLLNMQNGLADNTISAIYKDKEGFIWFGTRSGISRYDGKQITNFELKDTYPDISDIREVFGGILTVVSHERLYAFDLVRERFIPVVSAEGTGVEAEAVMMENDSLLWVISGKELRLMRREPTDGEALKLRREKSYSECSGKENPLLAMTRSADGNSAW